MITSKNDAYGQLIHDYMHGNEGTEIIERSDGYISTSTGPPMYFATHENWRPFEQEAIKFARGRTLDIGCGAGRVLLHLQSLGMEAVGIDNSPLAVEVCHQRGAKGAKLLSATQISRKILGVFDTIVMFGNNFGLMGSHKRAKWLLRRFYGMTTPDARILAESRDIYDTDKPIHLEYQASNRARGRMSGQMKLRVRHEKTIGEWFDYLMVSQDEMREIVDGTGWVIPKIIESDGPMYVAVLEKEKVVVT